MSAGTTEQLPTCKEVFERLPDWAEGRLATPEVAPYQRHLELCSPCGEAARQYQALAKVARAALEVKMPEDAKERLRCALLARLRGG
jgi:anti-sigma factor ChrR (cupin superfamily)